MTTTSTTTMTTTSTTTMTTTSTTTMTTTSMDDHGNSAEDASQIELGVPMSGEL
eukprot:CAMPEP_0170645170 /NCGR_PEP_ID=MMETSP0224-20130122/42918_1 /TAXON_ID=285029 /ORGANISM="Togula jolla, Strain CCCM 725" /LENGTH=53 /DNA_ID=CAMNT_0010976331 /DNA_START=32 /DNA_END=190 /DNA_ORIENTATION=-